MANETWGEILLLLKEMRDDLRSFRKESHQEIPSRVIPPVFKIQWHGSYFGRNTWKVSKESFKIKKTPKRGKKLPKKSHQVDRDHELNLSLSVCLSLPRKPLPPPPTLQSQEVIEAPTAEPASSRIGRGRKMSSDLTPNTITPPFPWTTGHWVIVHSLDYLESRHILTIQGEVHCKKCDKPFEIRFDLKQKFYGINGIDGGNSCRINQRKGYVYYHPPFNPKKKNIEAMIILEDKDLLKGRDLS